MLLQQFGGVYDDQQIAAYVNEVGQRAAKASQRPELTYTFTVLDSDEINAFTTGGGYVYITRGIMNYLNNEAELEAVLGHEIGHVCARHPVRQQSKSVLSGIGAAAVGIFTGSPDLAGLANYAGAALVSGYGRDQELEADRLGAEYLVKTGYSPGHMVDVVRLLKNQELVEIPAGARGEAAAARLSRRLREPSRQRFTPARSRGRGVGSLKGRQIRAIRSATSTSRRSKACRSAPAARKACLRAIASITRISASRWCSRPAGTWRTAPTA